MRRYFLYLSYNGKNYFGWQTQPNGITVQECIEKALTMALRTVTPILGAGRTDSGVHAREMVAHFDAAIAPEDTPALVRRLNSILPKDISIHKIVAVTPDANARFDALSRLYRYYITTEKDPFLYDLKYKIYGELDVDAMNSCADVLFDYIDFTSFSKLHTDVKTNNCTLMQARWVQVDNDYIFTIQANRFLRNMVRSIVGTMLLAGRHKINASGMRAIVEAKDRNKAGTSVPGCGLYLEEIEYKKEIFLV